MGWRPAILNLRVLLAMFSFKNYIDAAIKIWNDSTPAARVGLVLLTTLCFVVIMGVGYWSAQPTYVTLVSDVDATKMDKIMDGLDKAGIDHKISGAGGHLLVDQSQFAKAKSVANRVGGVSVADGGGIGMGGAFLSPTEKRGLAVRRKEASLRASIEKMGFIAEADVLLSIPDKGPFDMRNTTPSASVVLTENPGAVITYDQAYAIASLVAFSVEDLEPEMVNLSTIDGRRIAIMGEEAQSLERQSMLQKQFERDLVRKAENQLAAFLGYGNARVQVSADYTFSKTNTEETTYDQKGKATSSETIDSTKNVSSGDSDGGQAGTESNLASSALRRGAAGQDSSTERIVAEYKVPSIVKNSSESRPIRNAMTVSVIVNASAPSISNADGTPIAGIEDKVKELIQNAVGYRDATDSISVVLHPFPEVVEEEPAAAPFDWAFLNDILKNVSLAVAALVALVVGFLAMRKFTPVTTSDSQGQPLDDARLDGLQEIANMVNENPAVFAELIGVWAGAASAEAENGDEAATEAA